jgi:hypothetical protein
MLDIVSGCLKRNPDERMTIEQILDSEYLKDPRQKRQNQNNIKHRLTSPCFKNLPDDLLD